jgi:hypothetical protein
VAQGVSPGMRTPHPLHSPSPVRDGEDAAATGIARGRGQGGEGPFVNPRLTPWAMLRRPCRGFSRQAAR